MARCCPDRAPRIRAAHRLQLLLVALALVEGCRGCGARSTPPAASPSHDGQSRSTSRLTMPNFTLTNPGVVSFFDAELYTTYGIGVVGPRRLLQTTQFGETGAERDEVFAFKPSPWNVPVPADAEIFGVTGGNLPEQVRQFWVGWIAGKKVHMQALMQETPIELDLAADETPIFPGIMDGAGVAALYSWRPVPGGTALWRHLFSGAIKTKATAVTEALTEIPGRPALSVIGAIPGDKTQHALLGWVEEAPGGVVLAIAVIRPAQVRIVRSEPIPNVAPFPRQRAAIWASAPAGPQRYQLAVALQSREAPHAYQEAKLTVGPRAEDREVSLSPITVPPDRLHAAAFTYIKDQFEPQTHALCLTVDGRTWIPNFPEPRHDGVSLDDPLAVMTTRREYWGTRAADGTLQFGAY
jgi:hypothetical protein